MSLPTGPPQVMDFFDPRRVVEPSPGRQSGDTVLLPVRHFGQRVCPTRAAPEWPV